MLKALCIAAVSLCSLLHSSEEQLTVMVPMRDGTLLPTDLHFPEGYRDASAPCILVRSPSGRKTFPWSSHSDLTKHGFVVAIQDARNALDPEGKTLPYHADGWGREQDGYDTVEWLAASPYSNGKIGTIGYSAAGITQQMMAPSAPPSLQCQYIGMAAGSLYHHAAFEGGQLLKHDIEGWLATHARDPSIYSYICNQPHYNAFWEKFNSMKVANKVEVPAIHYGGWYDVFLQGTLDSFVARQERGGQGAAGKQKLLIGPWTHYWPWKPLLGDFTVPTNAMQMPDAYAPERWFHYHLNNDDHNIEELPPITYYLMGPFNGEPSSGNVWRTATQWPVPAEEVPLYLSSDHILTFTLEANAARYPFTYDPQNPVPTIGGRNLFLEAGPKDQRPIEARDDVIVLTSAPLDADMEITGPISGTLFFSSDQDDVDVAVRLCDVYPDGSSILITDSICRVGHSLAKETPLELKIDLAATAIVIAKGHCLRLSLASSNFPRFDHHAEKKAFGGYVRPATVAHNVIHTGAHYPSHIALPVVRHR